MAASWGSLLGQLARISIVHAGHGRLIHAGPGALFVRVTSPVCAEPMKKKKKVDPGIILARETRKKKQIEKEIRRLEKQSRKLKPIEEITGNWSVIKTAPQRKREVTSLTYDESERRAALFKRWSAYKLKQHAEEQSRLANMVASQTSALEELRKESEELYKLAVQVDASLIPLKRKGPMETPPIATYGLLDGEYMETTKAY